VLCAATVDYCASQCYLYSAKELRCLDKQTLHHLFSSRSLRIETEDALLKVLINLGSNYSAYWHHLEVQFLTAEEISLFLDNLKFDDLTQALWSKT
jgi:hypothetical protein